MTVRPHRVKKVVVALFVVALLYSRQIASLTGSNLYYLHWRFADGLAMVLAIVLLALAAAAVSAFLEAKERALARRAFNHLFLLVLASAAVAFDAPRHAGAGWRKALLAIAVAVVLCSFLMRWTRPVRYAANVCLVLSPYVLVVFFTVLGRGTWGSAATPRPAFDAPASKPPVFLVVFDGWSSPRIAHETGLPPSWAHLAELASRSFFFDHGKAPSASTRISIPAILYQVDPAAEPRAPLWNEERLFVPDAGVPSLFDLGRGHGYHTALVGFYFPYCGLLGEELDYCFSKPHAPTGDHLPEKMAMSWVRALRSLPEPLGPRAEKLLYGYLYSRNWFELSDRILEETLWLMEEGPENLLAFVHFNLPHWPYVFRADGTFHWRPGHRDRRGPRDPALYPRSLEYVDAVIGRLTAALRAAGKLDDALVILTADHGLNTRRVPLLVKLPRQRSAFQVRGTFLNNELGPAIEGVLSGDLDADGWRAELVARGLSVTERPPGAAPAAAGAR